eukprot:scaffold2631_cov412-Prasinococcus_capsulatus_cf.AAC.3
MGDNDDGADGNLAASVVLDGHAGLCSCGAPARLLSRAAGGWALHRALPLAYASRTARRAALALASSTKMWRRVFFLLAAGTFTLDALDPKDGQDSLLTLEQLRTAIRQQQRALFDMQKSLELQLHLLERLNHAETACSSESTLGADSSLPSVAEHPEEVLVPGPKLGLQALRMEQTEVREVNQQEGGLVHMPTTLARTVATVHADWSAYFETVSAVRVDGGVSALAVAHDVPALSGRATRLISVGRAYARIPRSPQVHCGSGHNKQALPVPPLWFSCWAARFGGREQPRWTNTGPALSVYCAHGIRSAKERDDHSVWPPGGTSDATSPAICLWLVCEIWQRDALDASRLLHTALQDGSLWRYTLAESASSISATSPYLGEDEGSLDIVDRALLQPKTSHQVFEAAITAVQVYKGNKRRHLVVVDDANTIQVMSEHGAMYVVLPLEEGDRPVFGPAQCSSKVLSLRSSSNQILFATQAGVGRIDLKTFDLHETSCEGYTMHVRACCLECYLRLRERGKAERAS